MARESEVEWWLKYIVGFVVLLGMVLAALNFSRLRMYQTYFGETSPEVSMRYELMSPRMDEAAVRRHFEGIALNCVAENSDMGERVCYAAIDMADGVPAIGLAMFFKKGRLSHSLVQVPWWRHLRQKQRLMALYGQPQLQQQPGETALLAWRMPDGLLVFNQDRTSDLNPLSWSVVMWHAREYSR